MYNTINYNRQYCKDYKLRYYNQYNHKFLIITHNRDIFILALSYAKKHIQNYITIREGNIYIIREG